MLVCMRTTDPLFNSCNATASEPSSASIVVSQAEVARLREFLELLDRWDEDLKNNLSKDGRKAESG